MQQRCTWPRCSCKATGELCSERKETLSQPEKKYRIPAVSDKKALEREAEKEQTQKDAHFYLIIWNEREHICENCTRKLPYFSLLWFHHILPKRPAGGFPQYRYCKWNIWMLCWQCHDTHDNGNPESFIIRDLRTEYNRLLQLHDNGTLEANLLADHV